MLYKFIISVIFGIYAFSISNFEIIVSSIQIIRIDWVIYSIIALTCSVLITAMRWFKFLNILNFKFRAIWTFFLYFYANFLNQGLPTTIGGDLFRVAQTSNFINKISYKNFKKFLSLNKNSILTKSLVSIIFDRIWGLIGVYLLLALSLINIDRNYFQHGRILSIIMIFSFFFFLIILQIIFKSNVLRSLRLIMFKPINNNEIQKFLNYIFTFPHNLIEAFRSILIHFLTIFALYCSMKSINLEIDFLILIFVFSIVSFLIILPLSLAGWGIREASLVTLLSFWNYDQTQIILSSVIFGILTLISTLPGLLFLKFNK